jgi:pyruvate-formate lyase-activating enzyme
MYDFANLLFSGPCTARCPFCIGRQIDPRRNQPNLDRYPPRNLEALVRLVWQHSIRQVVLTGSNSDPQAYHHEARLLAHLRQALPPGTQLSLHTNGRLALRKMEVFNRYDRACLSFPSFDPRTYRQVMGVPGPIDLPAILQQARIPVKLSCVLAEQNLPEIGVYLEQARRLGVRRVVLRKLYGDPRPWPELIEPGTLGLQASGSYGGNAVYDYSGMQVTLWDFEQTQMHSLNLYSSGEIGTEYLLVETSGDPGRSPDVSTFV